MAGLCIATDLLLKPQPPPLVPRMWQEASLLLQVARVDAVGQVGLEVEELV
jgi:hypothetical protein